MRIAKQRLDLADILDSAGRIDFADGDRSAKPALLTGIGQRARYRLQESDSDRSALRAQDRRDSDRATRCGDRAKRRGMQEFAAGETLAVVGQGSASSD
ncbi:MAG: hypothetical protein P4L92_20380 [Rudaea sp.]|nr:hypothetical protein [Rudaea sp.]